MQKCPLCPLYPPPPLITIRNETFFRVDEGWRCWQAAKGWLCLTDAQRYYTTFLFGGCQARQMGASQNGGEFLATSGELHCVPQPATLDNPKSGMHPGRWGIQDIWRASRPILSATRGAGETPAIPRGYAIILDARRLGPRKQLTVTFPIVEVAASRSCLFSFLRIYLPCGISPKRKRESPTSSHRVESEPS